MSLFDDMWEDLLGEGDKGPGETRGEREFSAGREEGHKGDGLVELFLADTIGTLVDSTKSHQSRLAGLRTGLAERYLGGNKSVDEGSAGYSGGGSSSDEGVSSEASATPERPFGLASFLCGMGLWILCVLVYIELDMPGAIWFFILSLAPCFMVGHWITGAFSTDKVIKVLVAEPAKEIHEETPNEKKKSNAKFWFWVLIALAIVIGYHKLVESSKTPKALPIGKVRAAKAKGKR